jgi:hypothetical protein
MDCKELAVWMGLFKQIFPEFILVAVTFILHKLFGEMYSPLDWQGLTDNASGNASEKLWLLVNNLVWQQLGQNNFIFHKY